VSAPDKSLVRDKMEAATPTVVSHAIIHGQSTIRAYLIFAFLLLVVFLTATFELVKGEAVAVWDAYDFFGPYFSLIADHARAAQVVLWNPWTSGGTPSFAEPQIGTLSPVAVSVGAIAGGTEGGFRLYWLLLWFLGPLSFVGLARHLRAPAWGAFVVALGFGFSGFYTGNAQLTSSLYSIAFLPSFIWRLDVALITGGLFPAAQAGALWGLSALGGYPSLTILSGGFAVLWALGRWSCIDADANRDAAQRPRLLLVLAALALFVCVGLLVLSPTYLGYFTETVGYSDVTGPRSKEVALVSNALHAGALVTFASPYLGILKFFNPSLWDFTDVSMVSIYVGASLLILALLALLAQPTSGWRWWLAAVGLFFIGCALGKHLPLRGWLYDVFPPTRYFRQAALFSVYAIFVTGVLALLGTKDLQVAIEHGSARVWRRFLLVAAVVAVTAISAYATTVYRVANVGDSLSQANRALVIVWLGAVAIAAIMYYVPLRRWLPVLLAVLAVADAVFVMKLAGRLAFTTGFTRQVWTEVDAEHVVSLDLAQNGLRRDLRPPDWMNQTLFPGGHDSATPPFQRNNRNLPLKLATLENYNTLSNRFHAQSVYHPILAKMATGNRRIWCARDAALVLPTDAAYTAVEKRSEALDAPVVVVHPRQEMVRISKGGAGPQDAQDMAAIMGLPAAQLVEPRVVHYGPNKLALDVVCPDNGWLLVTDRWSPGWKATVNGQPVEIFGGNFVYRAVGVKAGANDVRFSYEPKGWPLLLWVSWGTLALVAGLSIVAMRTTRKHDLVVSAQE
jgi:hypothetical protein